MLDIGHELGSKKTICLFQGLVEQQNETIARLAKQLDLWQSWWTTLCDVPSPVNANEVVALCPPLYLRLLDPHVEQLAPLCDPLPVVELKYSIWILASRHSLPSFIFWEPPWVLLCNAQLTHGFVTTHLASAWNLSFRTLLGIWSRKCSPTTAKPLPRK